MAEKQKVCTYWEDYQNATAYQSTIGIRNSIPQAIRMYEGKQWPDVVEETINYPRPQFNFLRQNVEMKVSNISASSVKIKFTSKLEPDKSRKLTDYANFKLDKLKFEEIKEQLLKDGGKKGTYILHVFYDDTVIGKRGKYKGDIKVEIIDVLNFFVANPRVTDVQKQEWIMFDTRESVDTIKKDADPKYEKYVVPDELESAYNETEQEGTKLCTVLTRYFRKEGQVYYQKAVKGSVIHEPRPLNWKHIQKQIDSVDGQQASTSTEIDDTTNDSFYPNLYPVELGVWYDRDKCIYGISDIEELIENQKSFNRLFAFNIYSVQQQALGATFYKDGALSPGEEITNEPGQMIKDNFKGQGNGFYKLNESNLTQMPLNLAQSLLDITKSIAGANEVMTGDIKPNQASGYMVSLLQDQAKKPLESQQKNLFRFCEKIGAILMQFFKLYFNDKEEYVYQLSKKEIEERDAALSEKGLTLAENLEYDRAEIDLQSYKDSEFDVKVEALATTKYNEIMHIQQLEKALDGGHITFEEYVDLAPESLIPNKEEYKEIIEKRKQDQISQMQMVLEQVSAERDEALTMVEAIKQEGTAKIGEAQKIINSLLKGSKQEQLPTK